MTGYTPVPAVAAGDWIDEIFINTYWVDNMSAGLPDQFSAVGQLAIGAGVDSMGILNVGANGQMLMADSAEALGIKWSTGLSVTKRQGGSASDWSVGGTTNYAPAAPKIQMGMVASFSLPLLSGSTYGAGVTVTFPDAFANKPLVLASFIAPASFAAQILSTQIGSVTASQVQFYAFGSGAGLSASISWIAIGE